LLQLLQRAKDLLQLQSALLKLDKYELLIVDDIIASKPKRKPQFCLS